jgi:hypothetical protein
MIRIGSHDRVTHSLIPEHRNAQPHRCDNIKTSNEMSLAYVLFIRSLFDFVPILCVCNIKPSMLTEALMLLTCTRNAKYPDRFSAISFSHCRVMLVKCLKLCYDVFLPFRSNPFFIIQFFYAIHYELFTVILKTTSNKYNVEADEQRKSCVSFRSDIKLGRGSREIIWEF